MKSIVVGTAGHIDHGKTSLVKALTGIDADRLPEEKRRGITIDIGFAHLLTQSPSHEEVRIAFVDVPGHERFVRNMLAGVGGIDMVMLVVAADEGIKPQTREHFDICRLLKIPRGITVLSKIDNVDKDTLDVARLEVEEFVRGSFLDSAQAPIIPLSARMGSGLDRLKAELIRVAAEVPGRDDNGIFRLPIDRVFAMKGHGTVITGTLISGKVSKEDEIEAQPSGKRFRVRAVQVHGSSIDQAQAGQRTALNLAGASTEELDRGTLLTAAGTLQSTNKMDVQLTLLKSAKPLRDGAKLHLHSYAAETVAEIGLAAISKRKELCPGESALAQLRLAEPLLLLPGDRFIVRQFSPVTTIGGGVVLDAISFTKKVPAQQRAKYLEIFAAGDRSAGLLARVDRGGSEGLSFKQAVAETGWPRNEVMRIAEKLREQSAIVLFDSMLVSTPAFQSAAEALLTALTDFHNRNPLAAGMGSEELRAKLHQSAPIFSAAVRKLASEQRIVMAGERIHLAGRTVVMGEDETRARATIEKAFSSAGLRVPTLTEVVRQLPIDRIRAQKIVTLMLRDKILVKVADDLIFHSSALTGLRRQIAELKSTGSRMDVGKFKELTGVSRKYAIPLLEYLDRERVTRRVGDERIIL